MSQGSEEGRPKVGAGDEGGRQVAVSNAMINNVTTNIQKLDGSNYLPWKRQVSVVIKLQGLERAINGEGASETEDMQATLILLGCMHHDHKLQLFEDYLELERQNETSGEENTEIIDYGESNTGQAACEAGTRPPTPPTRVSSLLTTISELTTSTSYDDAIRGTSAVVCTRAIEEELLAHEEDETWRVVDRPKHGTTLTGNGCSH